MKYLLPLLLDSVELALVCTLALCLGEQLPLEGLFDSECASGEEDDAADGSRRPLQPVGSDDRSHGSAEAVAEEEDASGIDLGLCRCEGQGGDGVEGYFVIKVGMGPEGLGRKVGSFFVAQGGDTVGGQSLGKIAKGLVRADGFICVVRAGTMHEDDNGPRALRFLGSARMRGI